MGRTCLAVADVEFSLMKRAFDFMPFQKPIAWPVITMSAETVRRVNRPFHRIKCETLAVITHGFRVSCSDRINDGIRDHLAAIDTRAREKPQVVAITADAIQIAPYIENCQLARQLGTEYSVVGFCDDDPILIFADTRQADHMPLAAGIVI